MTKMVHNVEYKGYVGDLKFHPDWPHPGLVNITGLPENAGIVVEMDWLKENFPEEHAQYLRYKQGN